MCNPDYENDDKTGGTGGLLGRAPSTHLHLHVLNDIIAITIIIIININTLNFSIYITVSITVSKRGYSRYLFHLHTQMLDFS